MSLRMPLSSARTVAIVAVIAPAACLLLFRTSVMRNIDSCVCEQHNRPTDKPIKNKADETAVVLPHSFPAPVADNSPDTYIVWHERLVSKPIAVSDLGGGGGVPAEILTRYVRATMAAFTWTPQAYVLRKMIPSAAVRQTFDVEYINMADFAAMGQRIDGVYTVQYRGEGPQAGTNNGGERVELRLNPPEEYTGPKTDGMIVAAVEPVLKGGEGAVVFANETWLWRKVDETPTLLENRVGRWLHSLLAAWLIGKGISAVTEQARS